MSDEQDERTRDNLAAELTKLIQRVLHETGFQTTTTVAVDVLLKTALAAFFPQMRQYGGHTLQLFVDGEMTEVVIPKAFQSAMKLREDGSTIALTNDEREAVRFLTETIARNPEGFEALYFL